MSSDVGMDKHVSAAGSDFQPQDPGIWRGGMGVGGGVDNLSFLPTHPEQTGPGPCPGLNPFHQSDLREKHSSIPEKRSHIYRSSGNRRRLMKCRLELERKRALRCGSSKQRHREDYQTKPNSIVNMKAIQTIGIKYFQCIFMDFQQHSGESLLLSFFQL